MNLATTLLYQDSQVLPMQNEIARWPFQHGPLAVSVAYSISAKGNKALDGLSKHLGPLPVELQYNCDTKHVLQSLTRMGKQTLAGERRWNLITYLQRNLSSIPITILPL